MTASMTVSPFDRRNPPGVSPGWPRRISPVPGGWTPHSHEHEPRLPEVSYARRRLLAPPGQPYIFIGPGPAIGPAGHIPGIGRMLNEVYNRRILELAGTIPRIGRLAAPDATATAHSKLCGSTVTVDLKMSGEVVTD